MERLIVLAPALLPVALIFVALLVYSGMCLLGHRPATSEKRKHSKVFDHFIHFFVWILGPVERVILASHLSPNALTFTSLGACASSGLAIATGHLATAAWLYAVAGGLDVLDGRLARATGRSSQAGAFLDSVTDRWCEFMVLSGFAWFLRGSAWLLVVMLAMAGSLMVSYTRARGEGLGVVLDGGTMQRAERIALVAIGTLVTAWFHADAETAYIAPHVIGVALLITGVGSTGTAVSRWFKGYQLLRQREQDAADAAAQPPRRTTAEQRAR